MLLHAAFGGSTNLLLHIPALAHAAGLERPTVEDWRRINRMTPRLVDALPNGPLNHPTVQVFMAGGVPEVMLHLRRMGLLHLDVLTVTGETLGTVLDWWEGSERRRARARRLQESDHVDPDRVIMSADAARENGLASTVVFPVGNIAPGRIGDQGDGDRSVGRGQRRGVPPSWTGARVRVGTRRDRGDQRRAMAMPIKPNDVIVLIGAGPLGTGMEETYQLTSALKYIPWGKTVALVTDARFSGVSTGACIGHVGPEALAGGPIGKVIDGDLIEIVIDRRDLSGHVNLVAAGDRELDAEEAGRLLDGTPRASGASRARRSS